MKESTKCDKRKRERGRKKEEKGEREGECGKTEIRKKISCTSKNGEENGEFVAYVEQAAGRGSSHAPRSCLDTGQHRVALR